MSDNVGWHQDSGDPQVTRYWDGTRWSAELRWDGTEWVDPNLVQSPPPVVPAPAVPVVVAQPVSSEAQPTPTSGAAMSRTSRVLLGGAAVAGIGALLPWASVSTTYGYTASANPADIGGAAFLLLGLAALVVWLGWPTRDGSISGGRLVGLVAVVALMTFFALSNFAAIADYQEGLNASAENSLFGETTTATASPGLGLMLWFAGSTPMTADGGRPWVARPSGRSWQCSRWVRR
ncbi:MAG: hypothetical protein Q8K72_07145 [Acidimicrobiales bacterium]|nr:hypothetical protein [Acidimicrobiales bacterium]